MFSLYRLNTIRDVANDDVELCVGPGIELAVLHNVGDLRVYVFGQRIVLNWRELAGVSRRQRGRDERSDGRHALAQCRVGGPLPAGIEFDIMARAGAMVVAGRRGVCQQGKCQHTGCQQKDG